MHNAWKMDREAIKERTEEFEKELQENNPGADLLTTGIGAIKWRLDKRPLSYRQYGPYWWALKKLLINAGVAAGDTVMDEELAAEYRGESDLETLIMADAFREIVLRMFLCDNNQYQLDDGEEPWVLIDDEYERLALETGGS